MNAPFSAVFRTLNGTAASLSALHETLRRMEAETRTALRLNDQNRERRVCAVQDATDELLEDFAHEYDTLKGDAESLLSAAEIAMNDILDPHFHRMQPQYFSAAMQKPYNTANVRAEALIARMQKALSAIQAGAKKIKNAFLLPDAAGLIGFSGFPQIALHAHPRRLRAHAPLRGGHRKRARVYRKNRPRPRCLHAQNAAD